MRWGVRAPTWAEVEVLRDKVVACFEYVAILQEHLDESGVDI